MGGSDDGSSALLSEPLLGILGGDSLELANSSSGMLPSGDSRSCSLEDNVEIHTENTSGGIILDSEIDMLIDTKSEVSLVGEIFSLELMLLNLEGGVQQLLGLVSSDGHVHSDLLVSLDRESSNGVSGLGLNGLLAGKILEHL